MTLNAPAKAGFPFVDGLLLALESASSDAAAIDLHSDYGQGGASAESAVSWAGLMGCSKLKQSWKQLLLKCT